MSRSAAELLYEKLTGIACLFKPADMRIDQFFMLVQNRLTSGRLCRHQNVYLQAA